MTPIATILRLTNTVKPAKGVAEETSLRGISRVNKRAYTTLVSIVHFLRHWPIIPKSAQQSPYAPWWDQSEEEEAPESFSLNPTAEILGYLYDYPHLVPEFIISKVSERVMGALISTNKIEMHDLLCCLRLMETKTLPNEFCTDSSSIGPAA